MQMSTGACKARRCVLVAPQDPEAGQQEVV